MRYVLCAGASIEAVGRMRDLPRLDGEVDELDGRGLCAIPGARRLSHARVLRGRPRRGIRVARGRRVVRGAPRRRRRDHVHRSSDAGGGEEALAEAVLQAPRLDAARRHDDLESKSGYGSDRETELASLRAVKAAGGVPTWLGAHAVPPEFGDADAYLDFAWRRCSRARRKSRRPRTSSSSVALRHRPGAALSHRLRRGESGAAPARRPIHGAGCSSAGDRARRAIGRPSSRQQVTRA